MRKYRAFGWVALPVVLAYLCLFERAALSQQPESGGIIKGVVRDLAGAVIPSAKARLTERLSGATRQAQTRSDGTFKFEAVRPGSYSLELTARCFKTVRNEDIQIVSESQVDLKIEMPLCGGPEYKPATPERFWTHAERKATTVEGKILIELAEALPFEKHWLAQRDTDISGVKSCLNKETVDYYFARVDSLSKSPGAQALDSQLSASANYEATAHFDETRRQWIVTLLLSYSYMCGMVCGNGYVMSCRVFVDEDHKLLQVVEGSECECHWIS